MGKFNSFWMPFIAMVVALGCDKELEKKATQTTITSFVISYNDDSFLGRVDEAKKEVKVCCLPYGTSLAQLAPKIAVSPGVTITPASGVVQDFTKPIKYTLTSEDGTAVSYTVMVEVEKNTAKMIKRFAISGKNAVIDEGKKRIDLTLPLGTTSLNSLKPAIVISPDATISPASGVSQNFTKPVIYKVTAEDGSTVDYTAAVVLPSDAKSITGFSVSGKRATIDESNKQIDLVLPSNISLTQQAPVITVSPKATVRPATGVAQDFTKPVKYTVTAENGTTVTYTVNARVESVGKEITSFEFKAFAQKGTINRITKTIVLNLSSGASVTSITPTIAISSKATVRPATGVAQDFTKPVKYTVTAEDGSTAVYTVTVNVAQSSDKRITSFKVGAATAAIDEAKKQISLDLPSGATITSVTPTIVIPTGATVSPASGVTQDFTNPVKYTVTAEDGRKAVYTVTVSVLSSQKSIVGFAISGNNATIDNATKKITLTLARGTALTNLSPSIAISAKATVSPASGVAQDFTNPVTYTVTAQNKTTQTYTVTVRVQSDAKAITAFELSGRTATIDEPNKRISISFPSGTSLTNLTPRVTTSPYATTNPASGKAQNFSSPVTYTVTAEDGSTVDYTVTVMIASSAKAITGFAISGAETTIIDDASKKVFVRLPSGTALTALSPTITTSTAATVSPASGASTDFSSAVTYTVTAQDGTTQTYTVSVSARAACITDKNKVHAFVYGGKLYEIIEEKKNWADAAVCAVSNGGKLAEVESEAENTAIFDEIKTLSISGGDTRAPDGGGGDYIWLGANDIKTEGDWIWDGANAKSPSAVLFWKGDYRTGTAQGGRYHKFGTQTVGIITQQNEPDNYLNALGDQDALGISVNGWPLGSAGQWNDVHPDNQLYYTIEF